MEANNIVSTLKQQIIHQLSSLKGKDIILTDCPYHHNTGDILIWQGELDFFKYMGCNILSQSSLQTFQFPNIDKDVIICLHGGGNFGDLYREAQEFRMKVISNYPSNRIIIFPQSVWYEDNKIVKKDILEFSKHDNVCICARDKVSFDFLLRNFNRNKILLVPDLAFFIDRLPSKNNAKIESLDKKLYFRRKDMEYVRKNFEVLNTIPDISDWLSFERKIDLIRLLLKIIRIINKNRRIKSLDYKLIDRIMQRKIKSKLIQEGVDLLTPYSTIYTTRLHAMILGLLMGKKIYIIDNRTNKISDYYETWLKESIDIKVLK